MKKTFLSILFVGFASFSFATNVEGKEITTLEGKPLSCTVSSGSGTGISATADTCEDAADYLALIEEVYWE